MINSTRKMPQLVCGKKFFRAQLYNKRAIVREGTGYPSNRGPRGVIALG